MSGRWVVLLHGQPGSAADWQQVVSRLPDGVGVVAQDRPGYGASPRSAGGFTAGARAVLADLAVNPATATHLAGKLARYFIADAPPPALVERMTKTFLDTSGDLKEVAKTMVASPESWETPPNKLKRPSEWVACMVRATGITTVNPQRFTGGQALLGEPLWRPSSPKGYPDDEASWIDGMGRRLDVANNFAEREAAKVEPMEIIETVLGSSVSAEVKQAVGRAETRQQALVLLFMSAEFQRR